MELVDMAEINLNNSHLLLQINQNKVMCSVKPDMAAASWLDLVALNTGGDIVSLVETLFNASIESPDWRQKEAAICALGFMMEGPTCEKLTTLVCFALQKMLNDFNLSPNKYLKHSVVWFIRRFFEFQYLATVEQSTCEQIFFDILLPSMDDVPDVAENACHAVFFLAKHRPYLWIVLAKFSEQCVWSLHRAAHRDVGQSGLRTAAYEALHEVVRFVAAPVILKLISHVACDLKKALRAMDTKYGQKYIQYECRGLKIILHKLGKSEVTESFFKKHLDRFAEFLVKVFGCTKDVGCWKDAMNAIGALAHVTGPAFDTYMPKFFKFLKFGLRYMRARELYDTMVGVVIRLSRALKKKILAYCNDILSQLHQDLFSSDLHEISKCSILCCYAELALAIGADFHNYLGRTMDALRKLTSSKNDMLKPESLHLICVMLETYSAIIRCFEDPSVSHRLSPFASDILDFLRLICGLDMDARVTTAAIQFVGRLAAVPGNFFSSLIYEDKSIQSFLNKCSISKDPLIKACADLANSCLHAATYDLRRHSLESKVKKLLSKLTSNPVQDQENEYSEEHLLSIFHDLPQDVDSYKKNSTTYVSLCSILSKDKEDLANRILAGKIFLTSLRSEDIWNHLDYHSRCCISKYLVQTLSSCEAKASSMAIKILKHIGGFSSGLDLILKKLSNFLNSDVGQNRLHVNYLTVEMLADVLKNLGPSSEQPFAMQLNGIHYAIFIEASEHNDDVILNWLQILNYTYWAPNRLCNYMRNFIFDATRSAKVKVKVAALKCLTAKCSSYDQFDPLEQSQVLSVMLKAMEESDKCVAYQAIVFWIALAEIELREDKNTKFVMKTSEPLVAVLLKILFSRGTQHLEPTDPDQHEETPNLAKAAFKCLHFAAINIGNKIIHLVENNVLEGIESSEVWQKAAGIQAFGSILVGPTSQALCSLITSVFPKVLHALEGSTDISVRYAVTWTLGQIFELHHPIVNTQIVTKCQLVIDYLQLRIIDVPIVAMNACHALSSLVQGGDAYIWDNVSPRFNELVHSLYSIGHDDSVGFVELNVAAYEALNEFMKCANDEDLEVILTLTTVIMNDISHALEVKEYTVEGLKNQCRSLLVITQKLGTSKKYRPYFMQHVHDIITLLTRVVECGNVILCKEAMLALGAIAYVNGEAFEQHMEKLEKCWEVGVQFFGQHLEVYLVMLSAIADVCRALKKKMLQFCDKIMIPVSIDASNRQGWQNWGPSIACICVIAGAVGDKRFLIHAMDMLLDKTWLDQVCYNWVVINYLRPGLVEAYRAIFQGLKNYPVSDPLTLFEDDTLGVLLKFSTFLYEENDMDYGITRRVVEVLERLTLNKGCSMRTLISQSSPVKHSEFNEYLVDHLCKARPSLIKLVQQSFQNEDSERTDMDFVGYKLVEVYALHVKTKQPCDLYGAIRVNAGIVSQYLYNQERGDAEPVSSGETALFVSGLETIPGVEGVTLEVDLMHKVGDGGASTDGEVCRNKTTMYFGGDVRKGYNRPLEATVEGKIGSVRISFIEYEYATPTYVKVSVNMPPKGIHGQITAYNMGYPSIRRELFRRSSTNEIMLTEKTFKMVTLYEGVVVVPLNSIFVVKADLRRKLVGRQSSIPFMKFPAEFYVKPDGSASKACTAQGRQSTIIEVSFGI